MKIPTVPYIPALAMMVIAAFVTIMWPVLLPLLVATWLVFAYSGWRYILHDNKPLIIGRRRG